MKGKKFMQLKEKLMRGVFALAALCCVKKHSSKGTGQKVSKGRSESPLVAPAGAKPLPSTKQSF